MLVHLSSNKTTFYILDIAIISEEETGRWHWWQSATNSGARNQSGGEGELSESPGWLLWSANTVNIQHSTTRAPHTFTHQQPAGSHRSQPVLTRTDYLLKDWPQSGLSMSVKRYPWWQHAHITTWSHVIITIIRVKTIKSMMVVYGDIYPVWPCVRRLLGFLCRFFEACTQRATTTATTTTLQQYTFSH